MNHRKIWPLPAWAFAAALLLRCAAAPGAEAWHRTVLGLCEDYPSRARSIDRADLDLAAARAAGARVLRIAFSWAEMEPRPGVIDFAFWDDFVRDASVRYGVELIPYVCYTPRWAASDPGADFWRSPPRDPGAFARFVGILAGRYRGSIHSWELWNEPDNRDYWRGGADRFAALVRAGSAAVRSADPRARVVLGGIAGDLRFLDRILRAPGVAAAIDAVNLHSYFETWNAAAIETLPDYAARAAAIIARNDPGKAIWMAETGYSGMENPRGLGAVHRPIFAEEHTPLAQANALVRTLILALASGDFQLVAWYRINDLPAAVEVIGDENNRHLGLRDISGAAKPALKSFAFLAGRFRDRGYRAVPAGAQGGGPGIEAHAFEFDDRTELLAVWRAAPSPDAAAEVSLPGDWRGPVRVFDALGRVAPPVRRRDRNGALELALPLRGNRVLLCSIGR